MIYTSDDMDLGAIFKDTGIVKRRRGNPRTRQPFKYRDVICAFDIETTRIKTGSHNSGSERKPHMVDDYIAIMYIWQFQIGLDVTVIGRTWEQFRSFMERLASCIGEEERILIFVHYLAHEWQYFRDQRVLGDKINEDSVFLVKPRTPVRFLCWDDKFEFRCSALHSNMSLDEYTSKMKVEHQKLSGDDFDYEKTRFPWTPLTDRELQYCYNDVIGLVEAVTAEMFIDGDNAYTFPLTSTGYVRRDMKAARQTLPHGYIEKQLPDYHTYKMLRAAFRGGNTHANRYWSDKRCNETVYCRDFSSSYPNVLINCKYPVTPFREIDPSARHLHHIIELINKGRAVIMEVALRNVELRDKYWPVPYLSRDKCRNIYDALYDNGRILSAQYLETTITDVDLKIICDEYDLTEDDVSIIDARFASYGYIPDQIRNVIREYYHRKTALKGDDEKESAYEKEKAKQNACYGMMAQNPVKLNDIYKYGGYHTGLRYKRPDGVMDFLSELEAIDADIDIYEMAHKYNIDKSTLPYQWGVWCTCHARARLERAIRICHDQTSWGDFLYCDTDSVFYYGEKNFDAMNQEAIQDSRKNKAYATDIKGEVHYMGVMEEETKKTSKSFKTLGAKKYAYITMDDQLHITIAGVNKRKGAAELNAAAAKINARKKPGEKPIDGLSCLRETFVFRDAGGTVSQYNDDPIDDFEIDGHHIYVPSNIAIVPSTYNVSLSQDYGDLIDALDRNGLMDLYRQNYVGAQLPSIEI